MMRDRVSLDPRAGWTRVLSVILTLALLPLAGCGDEEPVAPVEEKPKKTPEQLEKEREEIHLNRIREQFTMAERRIAEYPEGFEDHITNLEGLLFSAKGTVLEEPIERALGKQKEAKETFAAERLAQIVVEVDRLVTEEKDYFTAEDMLAQFDPEGLYEGTRAQKDYEVKLDWVKRALDAENEYETITRRARAYKRQGGTEDLAKAIGLLESYSDIYSDTPYYPEVQAMIAEYFASYLAERTKLAATEDVAWTDVGIDEYLSEFRTHSKDGEDVWTGAEGVVQGDNSTDGNAMIEIGEDIWTSYLIELEVKVPSGQPLNVGVTFMTRLGSDEKRYDVESFDPESSGWLKLLIEFRDGRVTMKNLETLETLVDPYTPRTAGEGGVAFFLKPGEEIEIRNVRTKVLSKLETGDGESGEEPDGDEG